MAKSKTRTTRTMCLIQQPTIGKTLCLLLIATVLPLLSACQTTQTDEPKWNDMYQMTSYQVQTITNEVITTIFIAKYTETNQFVRLAEPITDFGGYEFEDIKLDEKDFVDSEKPFGDTQIEFQCVDGSCGIKEK